MRCWEYDAEGFGGFGRLQQGDHRLQYRGGLEERQLPLCGTVGLRDYDAVIANFNEQATGSLLATSTFAGRALSSDLRLLVNTTTGNVSLVATKAVALAGYSITDASGSLLDSGDAEGDQNELLLSSSIADGGNATADRGSANYKNWAAIEDDQFGLSEGQSFGRYKSGKAGTYDTIFLAAGGFIDLGDLFNTANGIKDLTFQFTESNATTGDPLSGVSYGNAQVDYV